MFCDYFQARVLQNHVWFLTSVLRGYEHLVFDRTIDLQNSIFEFFVPHDMRDTFLSLMQILQAKGVITNFIELPNRLQT